RSSPQKPILAALREVPDRSSPQKAVLDALQSAGQNFAGLLGEKFAALKEFNPENTLGIAPGFKSVKDDKSLLSSEDLKFFEGKLLEKGLDENFLQNFMAVFHTAPELPTIGRINGAVRNAGLEGTFLNDQEKIALGNFVQRLGFSQEESVQMTEAAAEGKGLVILRSLEQRMKLLEKNADAVDNGKSPALPLNGFTHISREEAAALVKALNISSGAGENILNRFGEAAELEMNQQGFSRLFAEAGNELNAKSAQMIKIRELAPEAVREMLQNAKTAKRAEVNSNNRGDSKTNNSEALIREVALLLDEDENKPHAETSDIRKPTVLADILDKASTPAKSAKSDLSGANAENAPEPRVAKQPAENAGLNEHTNEKRDASERNNTRHFSDSLRQEADPFARTAKTPAGSAEAGKDSPAAKTPFTGAVFSQFQPEAASGQVRQQLDARNHQERIYEQLEQGIIKNTAQGSRQIILRLDPPELGRLTLSLSVANGEVRALIRAENGETAQAVSEQLARLKNSLEEQGFKVADLDVQTRTQDQPGMENHDGARQRELKEEMEAKAEFLRLAQSRTPEEETLARPMQNSTHPATIAGAGLHLVA
ncbi:MAG: flagellar hook-length control protein FliK, partial [Desulfovibrio sp.]|nr:flagellar hook-length control protein FliK [Desulfovibrio sp.]